MSNTIGLRPHGLVPELPSSWTDNPEVRAALDEGVAQWLDLIPPPAEGETTEAWLERAGRHIKGRGPAATPAARPHKRIPWHEPWRQMAAMEAGASQPLPAPLLIKGSNLLISFRAEAGRIIAAAQVQVSRYGPKVGDYTNRADLELVIGDDADDTRCWRSPLAFDGQGRATAELPDAPEIRALMGLISVVRVEADAIEP